MMCRAARHIVPHFTRALIFLDFPLVKKSLVTVSIFLGVGGVYCLLRL